MEDLPVILIVLALILISGCSSLPGQNVSSQIVKIPLNENLKNETTNPPFQCSSPYKIVGQRCCLDKNDNSVCDEEDIKEPVPIQAPSESGSRQTFLVSKVIDGDTIEIEDGTKVRLIGINSPEKGQPYYEEATNKLKELVQGKNVTLEADVEDKDRYDRLLRHLFVNSLFVNGEMVKDGYSTVYIIEPNVKYEKELREAWTQCLDKKTNLCKSPSNDLCDNKCIGISYFHFNAQGDDRENLNDEYVTLKNSCSYSCDLTGWDIEDEANHMYTIPQFIFEKESTFTLYTGSGINSKTNLYWGSGQAIWNNNGDTLFLYNSKGELVLDYTYTGR